jgi:hypothetical protein
MAKKSLALKTVTLIKNRSNIVPDGHRLEE